MSKKRLLIVNGNQFGYSVGHYYYCKYLQNHFDIKYICFDRGLEKIELDGIEIEYVPFCSKKAVRLFTFLRQSKNAYDFFKPEILFVVYFNLAFILSLLTFGKTTKILDIRTGALNKNKTLRNINNLIIRLQSHLFSKRIILSESLKKALKIKSHNTLILPLGSDEFYSGDHNYHNLHLIYIGSLDDRNVHETIEGLAHFIKYTKTDGLKISYTIIGFGNTKTLEQLNHTIAEYNLNSIVTFEGRKVHSELKNYLAKANIGIAYVPQEEFYQNQPVTKLFEYGLSGLFTIATNTAENRKFIESTNGIICQDNPQSFSSALTEYLQISQNIDSSLIRKSREKYKWENLCRNDLIPFLEL